MKTRVQVLVSASDSGHLEPKCVSCRLYQDADDAARLAFVQEWESQEALDEHIRSDDYRKILAVMELASERPEITFIMASHTAGMELIERLRG